MLASCLPSNVKGFGRDIDPHEGCPGVGTEKKRRRRARAAAIIHDERRLLAQLFEALSEPYYTTSSEVLLRFTGNRNSTVERFVVVCCVIIKSSVVVIHIAFARLSPTHHQNTSKEAVQHCLKSQHRERYTKDHPSHGVPSSSKMLSLISQPASMLLPIVMPPLLFVISGVVVRPI